MRKQDRIAKEHGLDPNQLEQDRERMRGSETERLKGSDSERVRGSASETQRPPRQPGKLPLPD